MREGVKKSVLSVCQSVCQSVSLSVRWKINVCVLDRDQSSSLFCISSSFLFNVGIVGHFDTVNHLDIRWRPGICWLQARVRVHQPPRSQDCEKLGGGLGTRQRIRLGAQVSRVIKTGTFLRGPVSCFMGLVSYSMKLISDSIRGYGRRVQNCLIFYPYNQL